MVMIHFKVPSQNAFGGAEEHHEITLIGMAVPLA